MSSESIDDKTSGIILAYTRSQTFVSGRSEVLHKVADAPLIVHTLRKAAALAWSPLVVLANAANSDQLRKTVKELVSEEVQVVECDESLAPMDAVRIGVAHLQGLKGPVAVIPADMPLLEPTDTLLSMGAMLSDEFTNAQASTISQASAQFKLEEKVPYVGLLNRSANKHPPVFLADLDWLRDLLEFLQMTPEQQDKKEQEPRFILLRKAIGTHYCNRPEKILIRLSTIGYAVCAAREEDMIVIRTREDLALAEKHMQARLLRKHMLAGVTFRDPVGTFLGLDVSIGVDTEIGVGVQIYGKTTIGSSCRIEGPTTISASRLEDGVYIRSFTTLEGAYINEESGAGPYARLREGTELGPHSYLGNFVETKNARLGQNTLACHLTYIGDAEVGSRTNIGAGTITCNYNGIAKNKTKIGDGAFVGSNSTLVAPVTLGNDTIIAAGSVVTSDVPEGAVVFGRARQSVKDGYSKILKLRLASKQNESY